MTLSADGGTGDSPGVGAGSGTGAGAGAGAGAGSAVERLPLPPQPATPHKAATNSKINRVDVKDIFKLPKYIVQLTIYYPTP